MHYVYIVRDTSLKRNTIDLAPNLREIDRRLAQDRRERLKKKKGGELLLIYYECLPGLAAARERKDFLTSAAGQKESRRWLQRWDKAEVVE